MPEYGVEHVLQVRRAVAPVGDVVGAGGNTPFFKFLENELLDRAQLGFPVLFPGHVDDTAVSQLQQVFKQLADRRDLLRGGAG